MRATALLAAMCLGVATPSAAAPHLVMDAGLVQEAGVQFLVDPTAISLRLRAESMLPLAGLAIRINDRDVTDIVVRHARVEMSPDRRSGRLLLRRLPLFEVGPAIDGAYRVEATVRDAEGATSIATLIAVAAPRIPFVTLADGAYSGIASPTQVVLRNAAEWETFWQQHTGNVTPPPAPPQVDFSRETVIAVVLGTRPTGGYAVRIVAVDPPAAPGEALVVRVEDSSPPPGTIVTQALTSPFHIVTIPRWDGPVRFE
jgi:hypothetical protein